MSNREDLLYEYASGDLGINEALNKLDIIIEQSTKLSIPDIQPLIDLFKQDPKNSVGGNLHIYLDDGNVEASHVQRCLDKCKEDGDLLGEAICRLSLKMTTTQRKKLSYEFYK